MEVALALVLLLGFTSDLTMTVLVAACCVAWLARDRRPAAVTPH
jgi:preprotein translocase subunit SecF